MKPKYKTETELLTATRTGTGIISENQQLANELHRPIIWKFKTRKIYLSYLDNIWGADLADIQLVSKWNKGDRFLLCVVDIYNKYVWVIPLEDKEYYDQ